MERIVIRPLRSGDLDAIVDIDRKVLGKSRPEYWRTKLESTRMRSPVAPLVAEAGHQVIGFILGEASGWEYGIPETTGYIDTIGVDPRFQRRGVARELVGEMITHLRKVGVRTIYTYVNWRDGDLLRFFDKMGFHRGDMVNLELRV
jgi:ribosomal protein S18 acetylase RimI-like enzyme